MAKQTKQEGIPELRFPEFKNSPAWEQRKLGEVVKITMGQSPSSENYTDNPSDFILVQGNADMKNGRVFPRVWTTQVTKEAKKGALILSVRAPVGDIGKTDYDVVLGRGVAGIEGNDFVYQTLLKMKQSGYWNKLSTGSTFESINSNDIKSAEVTFPTLAEQTAIGNFFQTLDRSIALHQRELENIKNRKKSLLQKMFPKNGENIPEIRFPEFKNAPAWERRKLGEMVEMNPKSKLPDEFEYVDLESVIGTELISYRHELKETAPSRAQRLAVKGDVFYQTVRPYQRNNYLFNLTATDFVFSTGYAQLRPLNTDSYFLLTYLQTSKFVNQVLDNCTGTSYPAINSSDLAKLKVIFPTLAEQTAIGNFFQTLDRSISLHQRKVDHLKLRKKALLQKMFP